MCVGDSEEDEEQSNEKCPISGMSLECGIMKRLPSLQSWKCRIGPC